VPGEKIAPRAVVDDLRRVGPDRSVGLYAGSSARVIAVEAEECLREQGELGRQAQSALVGDGDRIVQHHDPRASRHSALVILRDECADLANECAAIEIDDRLSDLDERLPRFVATILGHIEQQADDAIAHWR
jgi:hypothetical protein